jgi:hypothetical protein
MNYMLGTDENTVEKPVHQFSHAWDNVFEIMDARARAGGLWKILLPKKPMQDAMAVLNEVAYTQIDRAVERRKNGEKLGSSFLDAITEDTLDREVCSMLWVPPGYNCSIADTLRKSGVI